MKKKIITTFMIIAMLTTTLTGCGNMSMGFGNFTYKKIHVDTYHDSECFTVEKWYENENGVEVLTDEVGSMYLSEGTYIMIEDECPLCGE